MSTISKRSETKLWSGHFLNIKGEQTLLFLKFKKIKVKQTLFIQELKKIKRELTSAYSINKQDWSKGPFTLEYTNQGAPQASTVQTHLSGAQASVA